MKTIEELNSKELVYVNNTYCKLIDDGDGFIYQNNFDFFEENFDSKFDAAWAVHFGKWNPKHFWVRFDKNANLLSMDKVTVNDLADKVEIIEEHMVENPEKYPLI